MRDIILNACMQYENYRRGILQLQYNTPLFQKFKNNSIVKKSANQMSDIILEAFMQYENHPFKTVGEEAFYSYYILYHYFRISKIRRKFKNSPIVKKAQSR